MSLAPVPVPVFPLQSEVTFPKTMPAAAMKLPHLGAHAWLPNTVSSV